MFITKKLICYFLMLLAGCAGKAFTQSSEAALLTQKFNSYRNNSLPEKMYVHTDKELYLAGEILWFKLYAVDGFFHQPLQLSKVAYIEILDNQNNPILQSKIKLEKGGGNGSMFMPVTLHSGHYKLRAYSNWMKNFGADFFFEKQVTIINTLKTPESPVKQSPPAFDIYFYPEGGNLVSSLSSKIAFGVTDQSGKGVDCSGVIVNSRTDTVARFKTLKFGLGNFNLTPQNGQTYTALVNLPGGKTLKRELPHSFSQGYVMSLDAVTDPRRIQVTVRTAEGASNDASVYLFAHTRGAVKVAMRSATQNGAAIFYVEKEKLGDGISHFTIFNGDKNPVCERLFFKFPTKKIQVSIKADAPVYSTRQKINLSIAATNEGGSPVVADMSMAVYRVDSLQVPAEAGINEYLWLNSDLPGYIESPAYYFSDQGVQAEAAMDNLMLTKGWRRFRWEDVLEKDKPLFKYKPEYNGHIVHGKIVNSSTGAPGANISSFISSPGTNTVFRTALSDEKGNVQFELDKFYGGSAIMVQAANEDGGTYQVQIDNPFSSQYTQRKLPAFLMPQNPVTLLDRSIGVQAENIYYNDQRKQLFYGDPDTSNFYFKPNERYLLDNYTRFTTMEEVLREYILSVNVRKRNGKFFLPVYNDGEQFNALFDKDPLILLDGVPVFDIDKFMRYDPLKIRQMEVVTRRYFYGNMSFDGIVNLVTYNGDLEGYELDPNATVIDYEGLQLEREFYSPVYETPQQVTSRVPDYRNVLNWSPSIRTGAGGTYKAGFYSSDLPGKYIIVVQGLAKSGIGGSNAVFFEVKKPVK